MTVYSWDDVGTVQNAHNTVLVHVPTKHLTAWQQNDKYGNLSIVEVADAQLCNFLSLLNLYVLSRNLFDKHSFDMPINKQVAQGQ